MAYKMGIAPVLEEISLRIADEEAPRRLSGGQLIGRIADGAPICKLLVVEAFCDARVPLAGCRRITALGSNSPHRTAEATARLDNGVAWEARPIDS